MQEMAPALGVTPGQVFTKDDAIEWFGANYPLVKQATIAAHLIRLSVNNKNRLHYSARADGGDDLFFQLDSARFRLYEPAKDPAPIREKPDSEQPPKQVASAEAIASEFAYEHDLRDYLAKNIDLVQPGLRL